LTKPDRSVIGVQGDQHEKTTVWSGQRFRLFYYMNSSLWKVTGLVRDADLAAAAGVAVVVDAAIDFRLRLLCCWALLDSSPVVVDVDEVWCCSSFTSDGMTSALLPPLLAPRLGRLHVHVAAGPAPPSAVVLHDGQYWWNSRTDAAAARSAASSAADRHRSLSLRFLEDDDEDDPSGGDVLPAAAAAAAAAAATRARSSPDVEYDLAWCWLWCSDR
jgi:hypothetical protein